ncbi:MAG: phenylalanine--tRNA ligase subunit alpha [Rickettsiales bacterium]|jgi:phenylalanyl-tRNA synthetase alpha chain|nr:phenylalanine--tRNA ligase subunit alpha [Rickettsiales bacterium]
MDLSTLRTNSFSAIAGCISSAALEEARVALLGKKGSITEALKTLGQATPEERKTLGAELNKLKTEIADAIDAKKSELAKAELNARLASETIDVTLPAQPIPQGRIHPVSYATGEISAIFAQMGFSVAQGPDIEDDYHNFDALNIPASHPARQMHDTFYLNGGQLLRTHTSPVQIRTMKAGKPPFRFIAPGSTYRCDSDLTHTPMFHQIEGFVIDKNIHMGHLKGCLTQFLKAFFELDQVPVRFRPSFFPFTEPSAEVDIGCKRTRDELKIGEGSDWLEVMGCGMVHPNVLKNCGIDPNEWQGFAFGMGVERLAMLKYGIPDLRTFFESDVRWLKHYGFTS